MNINMYALYVRRRWQGAARENGRGDLEYQEEVGRI